MHQMCRIIFLLGSLAALSACSDPAEACGGGPNLGIVLTVNTPDGVDITQSTLVVLTRVEGSPPVTVDSAQGLGNAPLMHTQGQRGTYRLVLSKSGYATEVRSVLVPIGDGVCGDVATQVVVVVLTPSS
jgi:hypothetical protein